MKISKIYANKEFKNTDFKSGLNVVLGLLYNKYENTKDTHNLGKTSLIHVIDFLLLSRVKKNSFFKKNFETFKEHVFYIELILNSGNYLIIRRSVEKQSKISFKLNKDKLKEFQINIDWDHENISIDEAKDIFQTYIMLGVTTNWNHRKSISYFLRNQYDYQDVFQLNKFKGKHKDWKPFLFNLLGFDGQLLYEKYSLHEEKEKLEILAQGLKKTFFIDPSEIDKLNGILEITEIEKKEIENNIDNFNFFEQDKNLNKQLLDDIESKISYYNTLRYNMTYEIDKINTSLNKTEYNIDINDLKTLFDEVNIYFPNNLMKNYDDLKIFNHKIFEERKKYLIERLSELEEQLLNIEKELFKLDIEKSKFLSVLNDKNSYNKLKFYQKKLSSIEGKTENLKDKIDKINQVKSVQNSIEKKQNEIDKLSHQIEESIKTSNQEYKRIRLFYNEILKEVLNASGILSISQNKEGNVDFEVSIVRQDNNSEEELNFKITAEGDGTSYRKIECISFDLAILMNYADRNFYKFVYHDGVLEGLDNRIKNNFINYIRKISKNYNFQYILTVINSDISENIIDEFNNRNEIRLTLNDKDLKGKLFEKEF